MYCIYVYNIIIMLLASSDGFAAQSCSKYDSNQAKEINYKILRIISTVQNYDLNHAAIIVYNRYHPAEAITAY